MAEEYLRTKVRGFVEPMINSILTTQPDDPILYMINWIQNHKYGQSSVVNGEREELEKLRKEIKQYKSNNVTQNENQNKADTKHESKSKSKEKRKKKEKDKEAEANSDQSEEDEEAKKAQIEFDKKLAERQTKLKARGQRSSVSAEVYGLFNKKADFKPRVISKSEVQKATIRTRCLQSFIFNSLEDQDMNTVVQAFEEKRYKAGDYVIKQGEQGDVVYLVDTGELDCEKVFKAGDPPTYLKTYKPGESFGELALLYNANRAATIKAKTDAILWALDRGTFNNIVKEAAIKKRERYEAGIKSVQILSTLDNYELSQVCDAIKSEKVNKGEHIIKQNDYGDKFYILDEGQAFASKVFKEGESPKNVKEYDKSDYFGELALLRNEPRAASVIAKTDCKLLVLDRLAFKRLLGPLENLLQRNSETYQKYNKK